MNYLRVLSKVLYNGFSYTRGGGGGGGGGGGFQVKNQNIQINHLIVDSPNINYLYNIFEKQHAIFNLVNYSTMYQRLSKMSPSELDEKYVSKINAALYSKLFNTDAWENMDSQKARAVAQLSFYITKILEKQTKISQRSVENTDFNDKVAYIQRLLDEQGVLLFEEMNDQEKANFIYSLSKRKQRDLILQIEERVLAIILPTMDMRSLLSILHSLSMADMNTPTILNRIDHTLSVVLSRKGVINQMSCRDLSDIIFCYSKNEILFTNSRIFSLIEEAALLPYESAKSSPKLNRKERKILRLFENEREIDPLSVSSMLNSIANFTENRFSYPFYEGLENLILVIRLKTPRQLANSFRGLTHHYTPADEVYKYVEAQALQFIANQRFSEDLQSFSTIFYLLSISQKGSQSFYLAAESFTISHLTRFNQKQLYFIFYSFQNEKQFTMSSPNKQIFIRHILSIFSSFSLEEMASIISMYREFESDSASRSLFFAVVAPIIEKIDMSSLSLSFYYDVFYAFHSRLKDTSMLPNLTHAFTNFLKGNVSSKQKQPNRKEILTAKQITNLQDIFSEQPGILTSLQSFDSK